MSAKPDKPDATNTVLAPNEAIAHYESLVQSEPTAANYLELGAAYYIAHRWADATGAFEKTVQLDDSQGYAHYYLGVLYAATGQRERADAELQKVLRVATNDMLKEQAQARIPIVHSIDQLGE
jgi:tetratricopeptide (TPR) repeat protein